MARQLITCELGDQSLGIDIMAVREIRAWSLATPLPNVPPYVRGVVNLRGTVLPVIDLRMRLGLGQTDPSQRHVIIVVMIGDQLQGLIVDAVNDIVTVADADLQPPPVIGGEATGGFLEGLVPVDGRMVMVLDLAALAVEENDGPAAEAA